MHLLYSPAMLRCGHDPRVIIYGDAEAFKYFRHASLCRNERAAWCFKSMFLFRVTEECWNVLQEMSGERQEYSWTGHQTNSALDSEHI